MSTWQDKARKSASAQPIAPILPLHLFQTRFVSDRARLKALLKSRQIGGSFAGTLDVVIDAVDTHSDWSMMSRTGRQAKKLLRKAGIHIEALDLFIRTKLGQGTIIEKMTSEEIVLKNGSIIGAGPCDADTTVGDTVNWYLDEVALYLTEMLYGTIKPSIMHGKRLLMTSSPRGRKGKFAEFYERWQRLGVESGWSFHVVTIEDAMREGLVLRDHLGRVLTFEQFKKQEIADIGLQMWLQEYMCVFQDALSAFLAWQDIENCGVAGEPLVMAPEQLVALAQKGVRFGAGFDVGRRHDLSVLWIIAAMPDGLYKTVCAKSMFQTPFRTQEMIVADYLKTGVIETLQIDANGIGMQLAEGLRNDFAGIVKEATFTNPNKLNWGEGLRTQMQSGNFTYPRDDDDEIAEDFASIERIVTEQNNVRLAAQRGQRTHGDYFWAAALAVDSIKQTSGDVAIA